MSVSGIYAGVVTHTRHGPRRHRLRYRVFMLMLDLDEVDEPPNERVGVAIEAVDGEGVVLKAAFHARGRPLNAANLLATWATQPRPRPPLQPVTLAVPTGR